MESDDLVTGPRPQYGHHHRRVRAAYAASLPLPCVFCGRIIGPGEPFDLDHAPGSLDRYRGVACPSCNRSDGTRRRNARARGKPKGWQHKMQVNLRDAAAGLDLAWDRSRTSLVIAGHADHPQAGTVVAAWLFVFDAVADPATIAAVLSQQQAPTIAVNGSGHLRVLAEPLAQHATVHEATGADMADAHGRLLDTLRTGRLKIPDPRPELDAAVQFAETRPLLDGTALDKRRAEADLSPLVALELAVWQVVRGQGNYDPLTSVLL